MKIVGAVFLFAFFTLIGMMRAGKERDKLRECEAFLALFEYVKGQIEYFLTPTKEIYRNFSNAVLEKKGFLPLLRSHENDAVYCDIWRVSFEACKRNFSLSREQSYIIIGFGESIGKSSAALQSTSFDYYIEMMEKEIAKQRAECEKNVKLYRTLGLASGALAAILVI